MIYVNRPFVKEEWAESLKKYLLDIPMCDFEERNLLERNIANFVSSKYCVAFNSGTSSMILALMAAGIGKEEEVEVIGPNYSNIAWVSCCKFLKLKPVPIDIKAETLCMNPELIESAITNKTRVVIFVNHSSYVGQDLIKVREICDKHKLLMLEDSCSAFASCLNKKYAGTYGHIGTYSFSTPKTLSASEGGAVVTNNKKYYNKLIELQYHGKWYHSAKKEFHTGGNFNLSPILAHFLNCQLLDIDFILENKRKIYKWYKENDLSFIDFETDKNIGPNLYNYVSNKAKKLKKHLYQNEIETYFKQYTSINKVINVKGDFPVSNRMEEELLVLPGNPFLNKCDINNICSKIKLFKKTSKKKFMGVC